MHADQTISSLSGLRVVVTASLAGSLGIASFLGSTDTAGSSIKQLALLESDNHSIDERSGVQGIALPPCIKLDRKRLRVV